MDTFVNIDFTVTQSQKVVLDQRARDNNFESLSAYLKVVASKSPLCKVMPSQPTTEQDSIKVTFKVTPEQKAQMEQRSKESGCEEFLDYVKYIALNALLAVTIEVRSAGNMDDMVGRIMKKRKASAI